ncbi:MAG: DUF4832 domain-containing protein [Clostridia bacterium]|nr:DUF4832 domain-containing protein [Clostridia bacterium]
MKTRRFEYRVEEGQNPYIGFMSFQHFRGEKLYSDIVVKPENKLTETERVECYPVSADAEENGREEGWYPDNTVAYIRVLWKEFEPEQNVYNYDFIQSIIDEAKAHKQTLIFRLMAHSTRAEDDVPEWLKKLIPCPERPPMSRLKDSPTDPLFMELFLKAITAFGKRFDSDPWLDAVDISLPGAWGEGHQLELFPENLLETVVDTYAEAFPTTQLLTQLSRPNLVEYAKKYTNLGWRGDGLGEPTHTTKYYPPRIEQMGEQWKVAPVSFESYWWMCEWQRKGWDFDSIVEKTLEWHLSSFNPKSIPIPYEWKEKCEYWISRMGYHYAIDSVTFPETARADDEIKLTLELDNVGCAPCYKPLPLILRIVGNGKCYEFVQDCDIRAWLPGKHTEGLTARLPIDIEAGEYTLEIGIVSPHADVVYFATDAKRNGGFYEVGKITVK